MHCNSMYYLLQQRGKRSRYLGAFGIRSRVSVIVWKEFAIFAELIRLGNRRVFMRNLL